MSDTFKRHRFPIAYDAEQLGLGPLFGLALHCNREAIRIQGKDFAPNSIICSFEARRPADDGPIEITIIADETDGWANPCVVDVSHEGTCLHFCYGWLTDAELELIGAEVIGADEPVIATP